MKQAVVTGGAGLIGAGLCRALAEAGWRVWCLDLHEGPETARSIRCDVTDEASVRAAFDHVDGPVDLMVSNAGISDPETGPIAELGLDTWQQVLDSHLTGAFLVTRAAVPRMTEGGSIVLMASTRAVMSEPETEAYAAAKGGLTALAHALAVSLGPRIRVNAVAPGWISDDADLRPEDHAQHPAGRVGRPHDVAQAVLWLAGADFVTGETVRIDGGMTRRMIYAD